MEHNICNMIVFEPSGGAHRHFDATADILKETILSEIKELQNTEEVFLSPLFKKKTNQQLDIFKYLKLREITKMKDISLGGINNKNLKKLNMIKPFGFAGISYFE